MITKIYTPQDTLLNNQLNTIVSGQFARYKEVSLTFTASALSQKADVGFKADRYIEVYKNANITYWLTATDEKYMYFTASGAGTVKLKVYKSE